MRVTWLTESPRLWLDTAFVAVLVVAVLLRTVCTSVVCWIDATVTSRPTAERNRSLPEGRLALGPCSRRAAVG